MKRRGRSDKRGHDAVRVRGDFGPAKDAESFFKRAEFRQALRARIFATARKLLRSRLMHHVAIVTMLVNGA
jgi:DNA topoisomerase IB